MSPWVQPRPCTHPGCPELSLTGRCDEHKREEKRYFKQLHVKQPGEQVYDYQWQKARLAYLNGHPLCVICSANDCITPAEVVDHIEPHNGDRSSFWDQDNWQALCKQCHDSKTAKVDNRWG